MGMMIRADGRSRTDLRSVLIERGMNIYAEGSAIIRWGATVVHCTASVEEKTPPFLRGSGTGWVSAEYSMLPRATHSRTQRDVSKGKLNGRSSEIQRLIGRSLRASVDLAALGERTIWIDCDVIQADGGTRTASITGAFVCLVDALRTVCYGAQKNVLPLVSQVAAVSAGKLQGEVLLDLCYDEDSAADVDCNIVGNSMGDFVEIQGTGERGFFSRKELDEIINHADRGLSELFKLQRNVLDLSVSEIELFDSFTRELNSSD